MWLAERAPVEEMAALLWTGDAGGWTRLLMRARLNLSAHPRASLPAEAFAYALAHAGAHDVTTLDTRPAALTAHDLLTHAQRDGARVALREATRRHAGPPGFRHSLYPDGDRAPGHCWKFLPGNSRRLPSVQTALELRRTALEETGEHANVDLALATLTHALGRGLDDTLALFALAHAAGWLAHGTETRLSGQTIRPRARYVGQ